jgi:isopenicillin N synthase-like dioxygenase
MTSTLPILDLTRFDGDAAARAAFLADLRHAARHVGFFYLTGHGIDPALVEAVQAQARAFFALPEAAKLEIEMVNSAHFRGYNRAAWELTRGQPDWREQIDFGAEREALPGGPDWTRLQGPNQWPSALPGMKPVILRWQQDLTALTIRLLRAFALALGQDEHALAPLYDGNPHHIMKVVRYPGRDATMSDQGVGAHKDSGLLTLLLQDRQRGLQVETAEGWIDAEPLAGSFVVNIGELLEMASDGYLRATLHRVVTPPAGTDRISVAFFMGARLDATVPLLRLPADLAAEARGPERDPNNPLFNDVGRNYLKGRLRSHPDVARRHHADLIGA